MRHINLLQSVFILTLTFATTLAGLAQAHAQRPPVNSPDPIPGLKAAVQVCAQMRDDDEAANCIGIESTANWFTSSAMQICNKGTWDKDKNECLTAIKDLWLLDGEVQTCSSQTFFDDQLQCLTQVTRKFPYITTIKADPMPGLNAAANFCQQFFFDNDKNSCVQTTGSAEYFSVDALQICNKLFTDDQKLNCLLAIKNKVIATNEASVCMNRFTDSDRMNCVQAHQRYYKAPRRRHP